MAFLTIPDPDIAGRLADHAASADMTTEDVGKSWKKRFKKLAKRAIKVGAFVAAPGAALAHRQFTKRKRKRGRGASPQPDYVTPTEIGPWTNEAPTASWSGDQYPGNEAPPSEPQDFAWGDPTDQNYAGEPADEPSAAGFWGDDLGVSGKRMKRFTKGLKKVGKVVGKLGKAYLGLDDQEKESPVQNKMPGWVLAAGAALLAVVLLKRR